MNNFLIIINSVFYWKSFISRWQQKENKNITLFFSTYIIIITSLHYMGYELETFHFFSDNNKLKAKTSIWGLLSSLRKKFGY